jgi:hypothetical protein
MVNPAEDSDHAMVCTAGQGKATMHQDILSRILHKDVHRARVAITLEQPLQGLPGLDAGAIASFPRLGARGDMLVTLESGMTMVEVSVTQSHSVALRVASAVTDGAAAARQNAEKRHAYNQLAPNGALWCPFCLRPMAALGSRQARFLACWVPRRWRCEHIRLCRRSVAGAQRRFA